MKMMLFLGSGASYPLGYMTTGQMKEYMGKIGSQYVSGDITGSILTTPFNDIEYLYYSLYSLANYLSDATNSSFFANLMANHNIICRQKLENISIESFKEHIQHSLLVMEQEIYKNYRWKRDIEENVVRLYEPVISTLMKKYQLTICTTNYDKSIENFCRLTKNRYYDGFEYDDFDTLIFKGFGDHPSDKILYLKIHGSLNWKENGDRIIKTSEEAKPTDTNFSQSLWIAPTLYGKELNIPPFDKIYEEFKRQLEDTDVCLCIGYSFRDKAMKIEFENFIKKKKRLFILDPNPGNIIKELGIPLNVPEMKLENPDIIGNFFEHENITFLPLKFKVETIKEVIDTVVLFINSQTT